MKPPQSVFDRICDWSNLLTAWKLASLGKRRQPTVARFEMALEENLLRIQEQLVSGRWRPASHINFYIHEPKRRLISAAPFGDRVVHHAICLQTSRVLESSFVSDSYANQVGKGTHRALNACQEFARRFRYVLAMDIRQFFPSVDHQILLSLLQRHLKEQPVMDLVSHVISGGAAVHRDRYEMVWFPGDDLMSRFRPRGLPIGNLTSQIWANLYLTPFDHFVKRELRCPGYVRYVDDFRLFSNDAGNLWRYRDAINERLKDWRLVPHPGTQPYSVNEGFPFLGFRIWPNRRRLKRRKVIHTSRRLRKLAKQVSTGERPLSDFSARLRAWLNHASHGNTIGLRKAVLNSVVVRFPKMAGPRAAEDNPSGGTHS